MRYISIMVCVVSKFNKSKIEHKKLVKIGE